VIGRCSILLLCGTLLLVACSPRETSESNDSEWADIQPITNGEPDVLSQPHRIVESEGVDYVLLMSRLEEMEAIQRGTGETMITGKTLVFNYDRRFVRMDDDVLVVDDHGSLHAETLLGRFSEDNRVEMVEARKDVTVSSKGRDASADSAVYVFEDGSIQLDGNAQVTGDGNRLSGDQIRFWIKGSRRVVCEPNAKLEVAGGTQLVPGEGDPSGEMTKIFSDRLVFNEESGLAEFDGNVRIRDHRAQMNSEKVLLHLKENNKIDWIEALFGVIIQSDDRKAIADRAIYYADEGKFILEGDPKVLDGKHVMTGDRILFWHETKRMVCEPNARVLLYLDEEMKAKFLKDLKD
jgi:lipopolysaccharide export system protein LptA